MAEDLVAVVIEARALLGLSGVDLARLLGVTPKTIYRNAATGGLGSYPESWNRLVAEVFPRSPSLAARLVAAGNARRELLGLPPAIALPAPPPSERPGAGGAAAILGAAGREHADAIAAAVADVLDLSPRRVRPALAAAFARAAELGLAPGDVAALFGKRPATEERGARGRRRP